MSLFSFLGLCTAMLVLAVSPGPGVFATVARSMATGFRSSLPVIFGIVIGDITFLMLAIFGMTAIARMLGDLFGVVKILGGAYLIWLGIRIWVSRPMEDPSGLQRGGRGHCGGVLSGLLITLSNPKVILFYCGFLPTFTDLSALRASDVMAVVGAISFILALVLVIYAYLASRAREIFQSRKALKRMNRTAGAMMVAAGVAVAVKS